ncbi:UDP-N-acetylglucosamine 4,6-dehydratase (inverting) [Alphaproteobacteria bacterium]|nr:UDP-N-acetylglucosamine 4,6-dehydratase (inverting) [Alphaproteobacteria bacterium]
MENSNNFQDWFSNKSILISGGTGSFGQAFVSKILTTCKPKKIVIFSRDELKQYEMSKIFPENKYPIRYFIGDVRDRDRVFRACSEIDIIVHAAAMKHVNAAEYNPTECIATNVMGGQNIIDAAIYNGTSHVIALSTDKAANPINLYGASKLCSDKLFIAGNNLVGKKSTRFSVVRYGNVAGSRGSVIPFFKSLVMNKETVFPITDKDATRFIIELDEGVNFVIKSLLSMVGGEIFIPKLPSLKIIDLVKAFGENYSYKVIGLRAGEKQHEVMIPFEESRNCIDMKDHYLIQPSLAWWNTKSFLKKIKDKGIPLKEDFEYSSNTNSSWLNVSDIKNIINRIKK